jgi:hypothetical protein
MASKQFLVPGNHATVRGIVAPGATASLYTTGTTTPQPFYSDDTLLVSLGTTITADAIGNFPIAYQDEATPFRLILKDRLGAEMDGGDIDPFYFGQTIFNLPSTAAAVFASRTLMAAVTGTAGTAATLSESGREGTFVWDGSNLSTKVTADTQQGIYVAPASDTTGASGAWVRKYSSPINARWFGAVADCTGYGVGTDNSPAFQAAITFLLTTGAALYIPDGQYRCSTRLDVKSAIHLIGTTLLQDSTVATHPLADKGSTLVFDSGVAGIKFFYTVDGDVSGTATNPGASGSRMEGIRLISGSVGAASSGKYGVESRALVTFRNVEARGFGDHGFCIQGSISGGDGVVYGNVSKSMLDNCRSISNAGDGYHTSGNDANVVNFIGCTSQSNGGWSYYDDSLIGNQYWGCLCQGSTLGAFKTNRAGVACTFVGCEDEGGTSSFGTSCAVYGGVLGQKTQGQNHQLHGAVWAYDGIVVRTGNSIQLYNAANSSQLPLSYDGTNLFVGGPIKISSTIRWTGTLDTLSHDGTNLVTTQPFKVGSVVVFNSAGVLQAGAFPALTGDVTTSAGSLATTIGAGKVTLAMQADMATASLVYRKTAGSGAPEVQTLATLKTDLGLTGTNSGDQTIALTGDVTGSGTGSFATAIGANKVTYSQFQQVAASSLVGNPTGSLANAQAISLGTGLILSGTTLDVTEKVLAQSAVQVSHTGDTAEFTFATITIPAGAMGANGSVYVEAIFSHTSNANTKTPRIKFGGTLVAGFAVTSTTATSKFGNTIHNRNSQSSQAFLPSSIIGPFTNGTSVALGTAAINTANATDITITGQLGTGTDTISLEAYKVILCPKA